MAGKEKGREKEKARLEAIAGHCRVSLSECNVPAGTEEQSQQSGLGIMDLKVQNECLLSKWLSKLTNEDGIWQKILRNKYFKSKTLTQVEKKSGDS